jgi:hypothetical protein
VAAGVLEVVEVDVGELEEEQPATASAATAIPVSMRNERFMVPVCGVRINDR